MAKKDSPIYLGAVLGAICLVVALILALGNFATKDVITAARAEAERQAMQSVCPGASDFTLVESVAVEEGGAFYTASSNGSPLGYCVKITKMGYGGDIEMVVGINLEQKVTGVTITAMDETPGLGALAKESKFTDQFKEKSGEVKVTKDGGEINAISGATITSRAVSEGVSDALRLVAEYGEEAPAQ